MNDLRQNSNFDIRTLSVGEQYIGYDGATYTVISKTNDSLVSMAQ